MSEIYGLLVLDPVVDEFAVPGPNLFARTLRRFARCLFRSEAIGGRRTHPASMQATQPAAAPTVVLFDERGAASAVAVAPAAADDLYGFLRELTGYAELEPWTFVLSRVDTTLLMALYCNEVGVYENSINVVVSEALGVELLGKAVLVCMEEFQGDDDGEGEWSTVVSAETLLRKLAERGEPLPVYEDKRLRGRVGDLMHEMRSMLAKNRRG
jgi:hypothetical protein